MSQQTNMDSWLNKLLDSLPDELSLVKEEFSKNLKTAAKASLARMDLVTREEFEIQKELLSRTRAILEELEEKISTLESQNRK